MTLGRVLHPRCPVTQSATFWLLSSAQSLAGNGGASVTWGIQPDGHRAFEPDDVVDHHDRVLPARHGKLDSRPPQGRALLAQHGSRLSGVGSSATTSSAPRRPGHNGVLGAPFIARLLRDEWEDWRKISRTTFARPSRPLSLIISGPQGALKARAIVAWGASGSPTSSLCSLG